MADPIADAGLTIVPAAFLFVAGLVVAFFGKTLFKVVVFLLGAIAGGAAGGLASYYLFPDSTGCLIAAVVLGAIICGYFALTLVKGLLAIAVGGIFASIASGLSPNLVVALIAFLVGFVLALVFMDRLLGAITGVVGGAMAGFAVAWMFPTTEGPYAALAVGFIVCLAGIYYQNWRYGGDLSRPEGDKRGR